MKFKFLKELNASLLCAVVISMALSALPAQAYASPIYITFSNSGGASGKLNGSAFSDASWSLEYEIDNTTLDSNANNLGAGSYTGAVIGGIFMLNEVKYILANEYDTGNLYMSTDEEYGYNRISINPDSGGYMQFITGFDTIFPELFDDVNNLNSANLGSNVSDNTAWGSNSSIINYQNGMDYFTMESTPGVSTMSGDEISISEGSGAGSGNFNVSIAAASSYTAVPVPATVFLFGVGLIGLMGFARRKNTSL
jgi:hypothetical protein